jgi:hypothetical protein
MSERLHAIPVSEAVHLDAAKPLARKKQDFQNKPIPVSGHL